LTSLSSCDFIFPRRGFFDFETWKEFKDADHTSTLSPRRLPYLVSDPACRRRVVVVGLGRKRPIFYLFFVSKIRLPWFYSAVVVPS
jgi:hypothetical protein